MIPTDQAYTDGNIELNIINTCISLMFILFVGKARKLQKPFSSTYAENTKVEFLCGDSEFFEIYRPLVQ